MSGFLLGLFAACFVVGALCALDASGRGERTGFWLFLSACAFSFVILVRAFYGAVSS